MVYVLSLAGQLTALNTNVELTDGVDQSTVVKIIPDGVRAITRIRFSAASICSAAAANGIYFEVSNTGIAQGAPYRFCPISISTAGGSSSGSPPISIEIDFSRNPIPVNSGSPVTVNASMMGSSDSGSIAAAISLTME